MTSKTLHPSIDTDGWVNTPVKVADYLLSHFFLSDYSQTHHFKGEVASFAWILTNNQGSLEKTQEETQRVLSAHFSKQFSEVDIQVSEVPTTASINKKQLGIYLVFTDKEGVEHNLARIFAFTENLKFREIISVNNIG